MISLMSGCAATEPVIDSLSGEAMCLPSRGFEHRWTKDERLWCAALNDDIKAARAKAANKSQPSFSNGTFQ